MSRGCKCTHAEIARIRKPRPAKTAPPRPDKFARFVRLGRAELARCGLEAVA